jgi:hypothetical protein
MVRGQIQNGGFNPDAGRASVDNKSDFTAEILEHVPGGGRRKVICTIRTWGGKRETAQFNHSAHEWVQRKAHPDSLTAGGDNVWNLRCARENDGERSRPEMARDLLGDRRPVPDAFPGHGQGRNVDYNRVMRGTAFRLVDGSDGGGIQSIGGKAVNRFRGQGDKCALREQRDGFPGRGLELFRGFHR